MARRPGAVAIAVLNVGFVLASCASQSNSTVPVAVPEDMQPAVMAPSAQQEGKRFSAIGNDADCVLTTGDIHLWCKWISRYY